MGGSGAGDGGRGVRSSQRGGMGGSGPAGRGGQVQLVGGGQVQLVGGSQVQPGVRSSGGGVSILHPLASSIPLAFMQEDFLVVNRY